MAISRVSDAQTFALLTERAGQLQVAIRDLQEQVASGKRLLTPEQDALGAAQVVRGGTSLAALAQYGESSKFGTDVLSAQDKTLGEAEQLMVRAEQIATEESSGLVGPAELAAAREEVHGILQGLTVAGNTEFAGRRVFAGLALDAPPPFADPNGVGYTAANAYSGSQQEFSLKIGGATSDRVRLSTTGSNVFGNALTAVEALETALATNGDVKGTLTALAQGRDTLSAERASVGARQAQLINRNSQVQGLTAGEQSVLSRVRDADLVKVVTQLSQAQTALETVLAAGARIAQTSLTNLLRL